VECDESGGEVFGIERLAAVIEEARHLPAPGIVDAVVRAAREHCGSGTFADDFTVMLVRRQP